MGHRGGEGEGIDASPLPSGLLHAMVVDPKYDPVWFEHVGIAAPYVVGAALAGVALLLVAGMGTASEAGWRRRLPVGNLTPWESSR